MTPQHLALVEDDPDLATTLGLALERDGYQVARFATGRDGLEGILDNPPDLVIRDLNLPDLDGLGVCRELRETPAVADLPIIILTARVTESDRVLGLDLGADDYITKPFSLRELKSRIRALLRRSTADTTGVLEIPSETEIRVGEVALDPEEHRVTVDGTDVSLPLKEFEVLRLLLANAGRVLTRETLIDRVWGADYVGDTKTLDVHIKRLRSKVEPEPGMPRRILTIRGVGYKYDRPAGAR